MAQIRIPPPVAFFTGVLSARAGDLPRIKQMLVDEWGPIEVVSKVFPFDHTGYYEGETGGEIVRVFYGFRNRFDRTELAGRKIRTNVMEEELAGMLETGVPRPVNLDPGYVVPEKVVLASAKNFAHRIYIGEGIFAEPTLLYRNKRFETLPWTFPDFAGGRYDDFFHELRDSLMRETCAARQALPEGKING